MEHFEMVSKIGEDKMRRQFKNKSGRMELDIPHIKAKIKIYDKRKAGSDGNGPTDF